MKSFKLFAALLAVGAIATDNAANVSTVTVTSPVSTRTHTSIVFVTATAGPMTNTCLASVCENNNSTLTSLSTIQLTSFTTATTTTVVTPPDVTTTVTSDAADGVSSSCALRPASTVTVTVTETAASSPDTPLPVITRSVYPIPATSLASKTEAQTPPYQNVSSSFSSSTVNQSTAYVNTSVTYTMTYTSTYTLVSGINNTTDYLPLTSNIRGVPGIPPLVTATEAISSYAGTPLSGAGSMRPPRFFSLVARVLSLTGLVNAQSTRVLMAAGNEPEALSDTCVLQGYTTDGCTDIQDVSQDAASRFYPYPPPLNAGPPPHVTKKVRDLADGNATTTTVPGTVFITSTIVYNVTQSTSVAVTPSPSVAAPESPTSVVSSTLLVAPVTDSPTGTPLVSGSSTTVTTSVIPPVVASSVNSNVTLSIVATQPNDIGVQNVTILVTVTQPPNSTLSSVLTTVTVISHTTQTDQAHITSTFIKTVSQTFASFTGDTTPSATGVAAPLDFSVGYAALVVAVALVIGI